MDFLRQNLIYLIPVLGLLGLFVTWIKSSWVSKQDPGDAKMVELAGYISRGAMAFLKAEWKVLSYYVVIAALLLGWSGPMVETSSWVIAVSRSEERSVGKECVSTCRSRGVRENKKKKKE